MTNQEMLAIVQNQLAIELNCTVDDLNGEKDSFIFVDAKDNPGRRPYSRGAQHFDMLTMGKAIIVSATPARLNYAKEQLKDKSRDEAFSMPFIADHGMWYLPDIDNLKHLPAPDGFLYEMIEKDKIKELRKIDGFNNALQYDINNPIRSTLIMLARYNGEIAAMSGACEFTPKLWAVGIDVLPAYRNNGLAVYLVNSLTNEILERDIVPCYGISTSNIASHKTAYRAGYMPAWMSDNKLRFEGELKNF